MPLPQLVQPWLDRLSEDLGESSSVSVLDGDEIVYVARAAQRKVMSIALMPGSRLPAFCTSMGRVLLAALPEPQARARLTARPLLARTALTLTDPEAIMARLAQVRAQGHAVIDQEVELGLRSLAVPLMNAHGSVVAAVNLGLPAVAGRPPIWWRAICPACWRCRRNCAASCARTAAPIARTEARPRRAWRG